MKRKGEPGDRLRPEGVWAVLLLALAGGLVYGLVPAPAGVSAGDWGVFALFVVSIAGVLWHPYPIGAMVLMSLAAGTGMGILTTAQALRGYSNTVTWIIVAAFLFARAFVKTGLGRRIALLFIKKLGSSSLRLGYSLALADLVLAPVTASNTARTGGIIFPVARSLAGEFDSNPGPTARKIGAYLLFTAFQANVVTSAMFLTAMAANGLSAQLALDTLDVEISWGLWFAAASVPGAMSLLLTPYLIYRFYPPELARTPEAQEYARERLRKLGPMGGHEKYLLVVFVALATAWATSSLHGVSVVAAALLAVTALLVGGVLSWEDVIGEKAAWGTFIWFGGFVSLAGSLTDTRLIEWFIGAAGVWFEGWHGFAALILLVAVYVYLHYGFAGMTTQIIALYAAFLAIAAAAGAPHLLSALLLCFFANLCATTTHYGDGAAPIYYGSNYIQMGDWWRVGFYLSLAHLGTWLAVGLPWWRFLGIW